MDRQFLFICGCARSGTTALWELLTASEHIVLGLERYGTRFRTEGRLAPELFTPDRFFRIEPGDCFYPDLEDFRPYYGVARDRYAGARMVGDKIPRLYTGLDDIRAAFPGVKVVFVVRNIVDVAASFKRRAEDPNDASWSRNKGVSAAIDHWQESLEAFLALGKWPGVLAVSYEMLFGRGQGLDRLTAFVGFPGDAQIEARFREQQRKAAELEGARARALTQEEMFEIAQFAPFGLYRQVLRRCT